MGHRPHPYLREILQFLSPADPREEGVLMKGSQIGGSQVLVNWVGFVFSESPAPMVIFCPTRENAQELSHTRIDPMIA